MIQVLENVYGSNPKEFNRFIKFAIVGAVGAVIDFTLLNIVYYLVHVVWEWNLFAQYNVNGDLLLANTISVGAAIISNFTWNRLWTFPESRTRKKRKQLTQFTAVNMIGLLINNLIVVGMAAIFVAYMGKFWSANLAKVIAIGIVLFWNFGANRLWTYRGL